MKKSLIFFLLLCTSSIFYSCKKEKTDVISNSEKMEMNWSYLNKRISESTEKTGSKCSRIAPTLIGAGSMGFIIDNRLVGQVQSIYQYASETNSSAIIVVAITWSEGNIPKRKQAAFRIEPLTSWDQIGYVAVPGVSLPLNTPITITTYGIAGCSKNERTDVIGIASPLLNSNLVEKLTNNHAPAIYPSITE